MGSKFIEQLLRTLPFWRAAFDERGQEFTAMVKDTQRGTKLMQVGAMGPHGLGAGHQSRGCGRGMGARGLHPARTVHTRIP